MKLIAIILIASFASFSSRNSCKTTISVVNCRDQPVKGATAKIKKCNGEEEELKTDSKGLAVTSTCKKDICDVTVTAQIENSMVKGVPENCKGDDDDFQCHFKLCSGN
jgi:hypothetical protein